MLGCAFIFCYMNLFCEKDIKEKRYYRENQFPKKDDLQMSTGYDFPEKCPQKRTFTTIYATDEKLLCLFFNLS